MILIQMFSMGGFLGLIGLYDAINAGFGDDEIEIIFKKSLKFIR